MGGTAAARGEPRVQRVETRTESERERAGLPARCGGDARRFPTRPAGSQMAGALRAKAFAGPEVRGRWGPRAGAQVRLVPV